MMITKLGPLPILAVIAGVCLFQAAAERYLYPIFDQALAWVEDKFRRPTSNRHNHFQREKKIKGVK